ncbi:MAG: SUMF1/EgtB/PvdO family nonheme iron enzyme [Minisyncoccia bacterium]
MKSKWFKGTLTVVGAVIFSTLGIFAADSLQGIDSGMTNFAGVHNAQGCAEDTVPLKTDSGTICVDMYEASPSKLCPYKEPNNAIQSEQNANTKDCYADSVKDVSPWTYVSLSQAQRLCASAGKRLPTSEEWYRLALGTNSDTCTIQENGVVHTGKDSCVSSVGAYDAIGNVWEWVDENVIGNMIEGRALPTEGYVTSVDANGVAITSSDAADELYGSDYFWSKQEGVFGMIRGGFYGSNKDAGLYTVNASVLTSFVTQGVGFRCIKDL